MRPTTTTFLPTILSAVAVLHISSFVTVKSAPFFDQFSGFIRNLPCASAVIIPYFVQIVCPPEPWSLPPPLPVPASVPSSFEPEINPRSQPKYMPWIDTSKYTTKVLKTNPAIVNIAENDKTFTINPTTQAALQQYARDVGDYIASANDIPSGSNRDRYDAFGRLIWNIDIHSELDDNAADVDAFKRIKQWLIKAQKNYSNY
ncbi:hypothetical protein H4219_005983 [Mycoemilia scoparia]|uniref:Uncharacterized protein n=1 Tax=Mycoemilia scoparia TaxID=417184 RepID=A0A9W7ZTM2_9FUNG|nr:hypothetical protein H4219_005983 [Mycoemilia scoparia]